MNVSDLWERLKDFALRKSFELEVHPSPKARELTDDDVSGVLASCFGLGKAYFVTEAGHCEKTDNHKGQAFNEARARLCDELYTFARAENGKQKGTSSDELKGRSLAPLVE